MHAFDFILILFSFVYAAAVTQVLSSTGDIVIEAKRIKLSMINAGWMLVSLLAICSWWISFWDMRAITIWSVADIGFEFAAAAAFYVLARMVSPRIPTVGDLDLQRFHAEEGRKYLTLYSALMALSIASNIYYGQANGAAELLSQNMAVIPMLFASATAAVFIRNRVVQIGALIVELGAWIWYYGALQNPLSG
jgi:hypothetical protein